MRAGAADIFLELLSTPVRLGSRFILESASNSYAVREETGLEVAPIRLSGVYKNMKKGIVALVFRCRVVSGQPMSTEEAAEARFLTPDEIGELMDEAYACRLLDVFDSEVSIRAHDGVSLQLG